MNKNTINLPFTIKGGNKKSFKLLSEKEISNKTKKSKSILNIVKQMLGTNYNNSNVKINYIKGSTTKEYYKNIK